VGYGIYDMSFMKDLIPRDLLNPVSAVSEGVALNIRETGTIISSLITGVIVCVAVFCGTVLIIAVLYFIIRERDRRLKERQLNHEIEAHITLA